MSKEIFRYPSGKDDTCIYENDVYVCTDDPLLKQIGDLGLVIALYSRLLPLIFLFIVDYLIGADLIDDYISGDDYE